MVILSQYSLLVRRFQVFHTRNGGTSDLIAKATRVFSFLHPRCSPINSASSSVRSGGGRRHGFSPSSVYTTCRHWSSFRVRVCFVAMAFFIVLRLGVCEHASDGWSRRCFILTSSGFSSPKWFVPDNGKVGLPMELTSTVCLWWRRISHIFKFLFRVLVIKLKVFVVIYILGALV